MTRPLGIDPADGAGAAAVLVDGVAHTFRWRSMRRDYEVRYRADDLGPPVRVEHYGPLLLAWVARMRPTVAAVEAVHHIGVKRGLVVLAESAGVCVAACLAAGVVPARPRCQLWQLDAFGLSYSTTAGDRDRAVAGSVLGVPVAGEFPRGLWRRPVLPVTVTGGDLTSHEADAIGLALWVDGWRAPV